MDIRNSIHAYSVTIAFAILVGAVSGCGGGGSYSAPTMPTPQTAASPIPLPSATPSIQWINPSKTDGQTVSRDISLQARASASVNGLSKVDFFVDGVMVGTSTSGLKQPGVPDYDYIVPWHTGTYADGLHSLTARVTDKANLTADTGTLIVTLQNNVAIPVTLSTAEVFPTPSTTASGSGELALNLATGTISGDIALSNISATAVHIHSGFATLSGNVILTLQQNPQTKHWTIPAESALVVQAPNSQVDSYLSGGLYVDAHSASYSDGEIRAQLLPKNIAIAFSRLTGDQEIPPVNVSSSGVAAVTVDSTLKQFQINVRLLNVVDLISVGIYQGGPLPTMDNWLFFVRQDSNGNLVATGSTRSVDVYNPPAWYVNVVTVANRNGELRGSFPMAASQ